MKAGHAPPNRCRPVGQSRVLSEFLGDTADATGNIEKRFISIRPTRDWAAIFRQSLDRKSTRLNSSHANISYAVFCLKKKKKCHTSMSTSLLSASNLCDPPPARHCQPVSTETRSTRCCPDRILTRLLSIRLSCAPQYR